MRNSKLPRVVECIEYIKSCGFEYTGRRYSWVMPVYCFTRGNRSINFSLVEIREAFKYGF